MSQKPEKSQDNQGDGKGYQPVLKIQAIALLRFLIRLLEGTVEKLEEKLPPDDLSSRQGGWWNAVLRKIRAVLPRFLNQIISDFALTLGISVAILTLLLWITVLISPTSVEESPTVEAETPATEVVESPTVEAETPATEVEESPSIEAETPATEVEESPTVEAEAPPAEVEESPEIPSGPVPVEIVPAPVSMPEENLIAIIQNQVADSLPEAEYARGLIESLKADFNNNILVVKVSDNWYYISPENQNEFAQSMEQLSQELDFYKLEITDVRDTLLARSPVVGPKMVIFQRRLVLSH